jgi:hypothetical protein
VAQTAPFVREGLALDEPVMVALKGDRLEALRAALGEDARRVRLVDMARVGRNPARIIPAWQRFLDEHEGVSARGIGEPVLGRAGPTTRSWSASATRRC